MNQISDVVFDIDGEGHILQVNEAVKNFLGYSPEEVKQLKILNIISEEFLFFSRHIFRTLQEDIIQQKLFS